MGGSGQTFRLCIYIYILFFFKNTHMWSKYIQTVQKRYSENKSLFHTSPPGLHKTQPPTLLFIPPERTLCMYKHRERSTSCFAQMAIVFIAFHNAFFFFFYLTYLKDLYISRYRLGFLSLGTIDISGCIILCWERVLCWALEGGQQPWALSMRCY